MHLRPRVAEDEYEPIAAMLATIRAKDIDVERLGQYVDLATRLIALKKGKVKTVGINIYGAPPDLVELIRRSGASARAVLLALAIMTGHYKIETPSGQPTAVRLDLPRSMANEVLAALNSPLVLYALRCAHRRVDEVKRKVRERREYVEVNLPYDVVSELNRTAEQSLATPGDVAIAAAAVLGYVLLPSKVEPKYRRNANIITAHVFDRAEAEAVRMAAMDPRLHEALNDSRLFEYMMRIIEASVNRVPERTIGVTVYLPVREDAERVKLLSRAGVTHRVVMLAAAAILGYYSLPDE